LADRVNSEKLLLRRATPGDARLILAFVCELAEYERAPEAVEATEQDILRDGFGSEPRFHCVIAEWSGEPAGFALYFYNYSTWEGRAGIYLEDLYVRPAYGKRGIGRALFRYLAAVTVEQKLSRLVWQVLDWNKPAIDFYESIGARHLADWMTMRLTGDALKRAAEEIEK
jgi:GNAT superfamily N-acetyltransferase